MKHLPVFSICVPLMLAAVLAQAQVYKWVDKHGNVQFSDKKPESQTAQTIDVQPTQPTAQDDEGERRRLELVNRYQKQFEQDRHQPAARTRTPQTNTQPSRLCHHEIIQEGILGLSMPIYQIPNGTFRPDWLGDTYEGPRMYVDDRERGPLLAQASNTMASVCAETVSDAEKIRIFDTWIESEYCMLAIAQLTEAKKDGKRTPRSQIAKLQERADNCAQLSF